MQKVKVYLKVLGDYYEDEIETVGGTDEEIDKQVDDCLWHHVLDGWERVPDHSGDVWTERGTI